MPADKYKLPKGQKLATFKIQEEDWEMFKELCYSKNVSVVGALTSFIKNSIDTWELSSVATSRQPSLNIEELEARLLAKVRAEVEGLLEEKKPPKVATSARRGRRS